MMMMMMIMIVVDGVVVEAFVVLLLSLMVCDVNCVFVLLSHQGSECEYDGERYLMVVG